MGPVPRRVPVDRLEELVGEHLGYSSWHVIGQDRIDRFADATGDHQWIHVDPDRAADGPFGGTVAHGYLLLGMLPALVSEVLEPVGTDAVVNRGLASARFLAPVPSGSRVRAGATVRSVRPRAQGFLEMVVKVDLQVQDGPAKACVAETVTLLRSATTGDVR